MLWTAYPIKEDFRKALDSRIEQDWDQRDSWDWCLMGSVTVSLKKGKVGPTGIMEAKILDWQEKYKSKVIVAISLLP